MMTKIISKTARSMVRQNKNGTTSTFTKLGSGWKKSGWSGNSKTKTGGLPKSKKV